MLEGLMAPTHLLLILAIALVVLGPKRLPEMGRGLGAGMRSFKDGITGITDGDHDEADGGPDVTNPKA
jgi:sec-independent protein translocase protein TatA